MIKFKLSYQLFIMVLLSFSLILSGCFGGKSNNDDTKEILNVSYDPTRKFYKEYNKLFAKYWLNTTGETVKVKQSHGGSGKQSRSVIDGIKADVVTLALGYDIDVISDKGKINQDWMQSYANNSTPYYSTIVLLVRKGNPKEINDWDDLIKPGVEVITPNPKTSGGARWNYLAAYGYALKQFNNDEAKAREFVGKIYRNVTVLDTTARAATTTFVARKIGDVLISWENEAFMAVNELGSDKFEIIVPSISIAAEPPVAVVDQNVDKHGTRKIASAYLDYLYSTEGQELIAKHYFRPRNDNVLTKFKHQFPKLSLLTINDFGGWSDAQKIHFNDDGVFDQIYTD